MSILERLNPWSSRRSPGTPELPYDRSLPIVFDKDDYLNGYTAEYLIALAAAGDIDLRAIVAGTLWPEADHDEILAGHRGYADRARRSGLRNVPEVLEGAFRALQRPASDRIEDTEPIECPGARRIVDEARAASPDRRLLIVTGGSLTVTASAVLLDPSIADRIVVAAAVGRPADMGDYNGFIDGWASYVVLQRLIYVQFQPMFQPPQVPKRRFRRLPPSELRDWLIAKEAPYSNLPNGEDIDGGPAISIMRPDYVLEARRVSFSHWLSKTVRSIPKHDVVHFPAFKDDPAGRAIVVTRASTAIATREFWRAFRDPRVWEA